jgi:hypothetical protein
VKLYCECCGRPYPRSRAREIALDVLAQVDAIRLEDQSGVPTLAILDANRVTILERAGHSTLGDTSQAGNRLLKLRGIGPGTVAALKAFYNEALVRTLEERYGAVLRQPE